MYQQALTLIKQYPRIIIHRHHHPDGDAIGSQMGFYHLVRDNFPDKEVYIVGDAPGRYAFVPGCQPMQIEDSLYEGALAVLLDMAAPHLVSDDRYRLAAATLRFDHHLYVEKFTTAEVIDTSFESCCGLVADFALSAGLHLSAEAASALYTGMVTDSGRFRYDSTSPRTHRLAAALLEAGVDTNAIFAELYADDYRMMRLRAEFILNINFTDHGVAYIYTDLERFKSFGVDTFTISRGMVNVMSDIRGVHSWVNFTETEEGVQCELRSKKYNINPIAVKYGGGGHVKASGAMVKYREEAMQMLADLDKLGE